MKKNVWNRHRRKVPMLKVVTVAVSRLIMLQFAPVEDLIGLTRMEKCTAGAVNQLALSAATIQHITLETVQTEILSRLNVGDRSI